jgi:eukaryotic-like serine/threonine-protein kinase
MASPVPSFFDRARVRLRHAWQWSRPVLVTPVFWLGLGGVLLAAVGLYLLVNSVIMPTYTRQGAAITVPEVREMPYEQAAQILRAQRLRPERRDQPFNPAAVQGAVLDQNPAPNASVKPGRRIYLYVNSGTERSVTMPEVRTLTESLARSQLAELGLRQVEVRRDEQPSPFPGTVTRQQPEAGNVLRTSESVTLWVSPGLGEGTVEVPDVRGLAFDAAAQALLAVNLWIDPTREVSGTITRQEPSAGAEVRTGTEVRLSSAPIEAPPEFPEDPTFEDEDPFEPLPPDEPLEADPFEDEPPPPPRAPERTDW